MKLLLIQGDVACIGLLILLVFRYVVIVVVFVRFMFCFTFDVLCVSMCVV